jgi:hypothetical protein
MSGGNTSYSDFTAPSEGYVYYVVEIVLDQPCVLTKSLSSIRSNIASNDPNVSVVELKIDNEKLRVYPNPVNSQLRITNYESGDYSIFSVMGQVLMQGKLQNNTINVEALSSGMYYLKVDGKTVKFVKE